jgi:MFS family permease
MVLSYLWFTAGFCFYGLILNLEHLGGNLFADSIVTFLGELASEILSGYCADEFGRVIVLKFGALFGGVSFIFYELITDATLKSILLFCTSIGFSAFFNAIYIFSPEAVPTSVRSTVMGFLYLISRLGALMAPTVSAVLPHSAICYGFVSVFAFYFCFQLKETLGKEIPEDVPESKRQQSFLSRTASKRKISYTSKRSFNRTIVSDLYFKIDEA